MIFCEQLSLIQVSDYPKESMTVSAATLPPASAATESEEVAEIEGEDDGLEGNGVEEDGEIYL